MAGRRGRCAGVVAGVDGRLFEGVDGRFLKTEGGPLAGGGVPGVGAPAKPRGFEEAGFEPELHDIIIGAP